jgi:hypothetical protein
MESNISVLCLESQRSSILGAIGKKSQADFAGLQQLLENSPWNQCRNHIDHG